MASTQAGVILRHIRGLTADLSSEAPDRDLLERFAARGEEAAFETLVKRHGPLVLGVCRRVLGNAHDAEDAFQAAFLALARKAESIRNRESIGCWLYRVAFHAAVRARGQAATRKKVERQASQHPPQDPFAELTGRELLSVLDEELQALPERYRAPLVLCYLQGLTCDEAARRAGWSQRTFKRRLEQARGRLRGRLAHRGLTLPGALMATGLAHAAEAAVPTSLAGATVRTVLRGAAGKATPSGEAAAVSSLAGGAAGFLGSVRLKVAVAVLLLGCLVALGAGALAQQAPPLAGKQAGAAKKQAVPVPTDKDKPAAPAKKGVTVRGRVLGADGKPLAGAEVALVGRWHPSKEHPNHDYEVLAQGKTDAAGRFRLGRKDLDPTTFYHFHALAGAKGHGLGWARLPQVPKQEGVELQLEAERVIRGRLFDLQGVPARGVKGRLVYVAWKEPKADKDTPRDRLMRAQMLRARREMMRAHGQGVVPFRQPGGFEFDLHPVPAGLALWPKAITTDAQGRFAVHGLSPGQEAHLLIEDDRFALQELQVQTGDKKAPAEVTLSLSPAQRIEGRVVYEDTGKPVVGAHLLLSAFRDRVGKDAGVRTDAQGRFTINPYPGTSYQIRAWAPDREPYLNVEKHLAWPKGAARQTVNFALPRGVEIRGKVLEAASGKVVRGAHVAYVPQRDNAVAKKHQLLVGSYLPARDTEAGSYRLIVPPGPGHLLVDGGEPNFIVPPTTLDEVRTGKLGGVGRFRHAVVFLEPKLEDGPRKLDIKLRRGVTLRGTVLGPDGKRLRQGMMICPSELVPPNFSQPVVFSPAGSPPRGVILVEGRFELFGCDPEKTYRVFVVDVLGGRGSGYGAPMPILRVPQPLSRATTLGGDFQASAGAVVEISAAKAKKGELTVRLQPCGSAQVKLRDAAGKPSQAIPWVELEVTPDHGKRAGERVVLGPPGLIVSGKTPMTPDAAGRLTVRGLIPGATYRLKVYDFRAQTVVPLGAAFTVESGKTRKLPAVVAPRTPAAP